MPQFWDFLGDGVFVAHNVSFDFRFLSSVTKRLLGSVLDNEQVCTLRLARKLIPTLRRKNLGALAEHFEIEIENRHRALGDADATALVLLEFLKTMGEMEITTLAKMLDYQKRGGKRYGDIKIPFPEHRLSGYPQTPGVYMMRDEKGDILYIGKAKNLRKRLQSYFTNLVRQPTKVQELMPQVMDIETHQLGSELEALLEESRLIKSHQPYYNRQIKNFRTFPFLKIAIGEKYPSITVTSDIENDGSLYFGPYRQKHKLTALIRELSRVFQLRSCTDKVFDQYAKKGIPCMAYEIGACSGPCVKKVLAAEYHQQVQEIVDFLEGRVSDVTGRMMAQREKYSEALAFEKAQEVQKRLMGLLKLQSSTQALTQAVHQNHLLIILPDREPGRKLLLYVFKGRPIQKQVFDPSTDSLESIYLRVEMLQRMLTTPVNDKPDIIQQMEVEEIRIIAHWLKYLQQEDLESKVLDLTRPAGPLQAEIMDYFSTQTRIPLFDESVGF
jgi:DNA polymerase-3 subunit epsilon